MALVNTTYLLPQGKSAALEYIEKALLEELEANRLRTQAAREQYSGMMPGIDEKHDKLAAESYANLLYGERSAANSLASSGLYNSGYADTYRTMQHTEYARQHGENELARIGAIREVEGLIGSAEEAGRESEAKINANYQLKIADQIKYDREYADKQAALEYERLQKEQELLYQRGQAELANAYKAAEIGDFSQLERLGVDTAQAKKLYAAKLAAAKTGSAAQKQTVTLDAYSSELAAGMAKELVSDYYGKRNLSYADALRLAGEKKSEIVARYGEAFWDKYIETLSASYPGSPQYKKDDSTRYSTMKDIIAFISDGANAYRFYDKKGYNARAIYDFIAASSLPQAEKLELFRYYGLL